ncbi:transcriptional regulator, XRE family [Xylanimonas cellulosilytica DSM 15894]|uniref:Transcriptional regulator, XRE family n=2 Tax=Xylanimonas TaxID=186188 RepID=D1BYM4_XYLCX|nr:transcriptional regulator, XRE family [Xylanimonas cellulosilytica DSM 15894]
MQVRTMADVGALLREAREDAGLTQVELARRARVSREWLIKVESGRTSAELPRILAVLAELDLTLDISRREP